MSASFFDSNVLIYAATKDPQKAARARQLMLVGGTISVQVLNEIANATLKKRTMTWPQILAFLDLVKQLVRIVPIDMAVHTNGLLIAQRYRLAIYDAMIAAAALQANCDTLYSEDMHDGLLIDGKLRIVNPFRAP